MYSTSKPLLCYVCSLWLMLALLLLLDLAPSATSSAFAEEAEQAVDLITQEEFDRLVVESEQSRREYRERLARGLDKPPAEKTWQPPQERVNGFRRGMAARAACLFDRPYRFVPPELSPKVQEMLKKEVAAIRGRSTENRVFAVDMKSIYQRRSQGLSHFFPDWVFLDIPVLRAQARPDQSPEIVYGVLPESYTYAFHEPDGKVDGETFPGGGSNWSSMFGEFAKRCGATVKGSRDAGLLWNAYAALCQERPALITVRELRFGVWNVTSESWKGSSLDIITDSEGRLRDFIRKEPGGTTSRPETP